jgi:hypothetical protein
MSSAKSSAALRQVIRSELPRKMILSAWPVRICVWVVALDQDVVHTDVVSHLEARRIIDCTEPEVALHHLARRELVLPCSIHL